jgi:hypothetical protein
MQSREQVGRFAPLYTLTKNQTTGAADLPQFPVTDYLSPISGGPTQFWSYSSLIQPIIINERILINDYGSDPSFQPGDFYSPIPVNPPNPNGADWEPFWRYRFATRLFDFLTVQAPHDDYLPNYPAHQPYDPGRDYTAGEIVQFRHWLQRPTAQPDLYICKQYQPVVDLAAFNNTFFRVDSWELVVRGTEQPTRPSDRALTSRQPVSNTPGTTPGESDDPKTVTAEYDQAVQGLININTADWKVLSTLPLVVNPATGVPDAGEVPQYRHLNLNPPLTYRDLNEEMARVIVYFRDIDGQPNAKPGTPLPAGTQDIRVPHGPFKNLFELNRVVDLRPSSRWAVVNPFFGKTFADGLGTLEMSYVNMDPDVMTDDPGNPSGATYGYVFDPDGGAGDLSPGKYLNWEILDSRREDFTISPAESRYYPYARNDEDRYDGVRGDFEEQFLQLSRISNLITTRSDSFTAWILIQGYRDANTANPKLEVQKRVAYIIDRSKMPYKPVEKILVPND